MKIISVIPVNGRESIIKNTINRLIKQVYKVIIAGHTNDEANICEGSDFYLCDNNMTVGAKWQFCVNKSREYSPDAILIVGSGGMISDNWCEILYNDLIDYDMVGSAGIYFLDYQPISKRLFYWPGYKGSRSLEPIGMGRLISKSFLDKVNWQIFDKNSNSGLDHSTMRIIGRNSGKVNINRSPDIKSMRISSYKYVQKDSYDRLRRHPGAKEINNINEFLALNFPEAL